MLWDDPARIDASLDSRAITFENVTGARGAGGQAHGGRKGAPNRVIAPGERVTLADIEGPGRIRHFWMTIPPARPDVMRAVWLDVFYDGIEEASISAPLLDFFGAPHGRPAAYDSAMTSIHEARGFNSYLPMPFRKHLRMELTNHSPRDQYLYYQLDYTLEPSLPDDAGYLHVGFRRENPTVMGRDFVIADGLAGPGRFLGCAVGVRVLDEGTWYGEGEVKIFRDGDGEYPTICGTGLEDYVGTAWGMGAHTALYAGVPLSLQEPGASGQPAFVSFYRWHLPDPVIFREDLRVTIQQIGYAGFPAKDAAGFERYAATHPPAGGGWERNDPAFIARGIAERVDDYCATAFVYCMTPQPVPRVDVADAIADIGLRDWERRRPARQDQA